MEPNIGLAVDYIDSCISWLWHIRDSHDDIDIGSEEFAQIVMNKVSEIEDYLQQARYELTGDKNPSIDIGIDMADDNLADYH